MTPQDLAKEIVDKYWKKTGFTDPNPYLLETDIATVLTQYADERLEEVACLIQNQCGWIVSNGVVCGNCYYCNDATTVRSLKSSGGKV